MPVTARRTALQGAVSLTSDASTRSTGRTLAKHRKITKSTSAPRAAAAVLSVGLAVGGGAAITVVAAPQTAAAATTTSLTAAQVRGNTSIASRPLIRFRDSGKTVKYIQKTLRRPRTATSATARWPRSRSSSVPGASRPPAT